MVNDETWMKEFPELQMEISLILHDRGPNRVEILPNCRGIISIFCTIDYIIFIGYFENFKYPVSVIEILVQFFLGILYGKLHAVYI